MRHRDKFPLTTSGERILDWFIRSEYFAQWTESNLGNQLFISDPERADRIHEYAKDGLDGSTHAEHIEDWRAAWRDFLSDCGKWEHPERVANAVDTAIDSCWDWHVKNGSIEQVVG